MSNRRKFKVFVDGKQYKPSGKKMVVCTSGGVFLIIDSDGFYTYVRKLSDVLPYYDIKWSDDNED